MTVFYPEISPDSSKVAFNGLTANGGLGIYVMNIGGGTPAQVVDFGHGPTWSPDGNSLAFAGLVPGKHLFEQGHWCDIHIVDLRTKQVFVLPSNKNRYGPWWPEPNKLVALGYEEDNGLQLFDFKTQKWSTLNDSIGVEIWAPSSDGRSFYLLGADPDRVLKISSPGYILEIVAELAGMRLVNDGALSQASSGGWIGIAADGSPTVTQTVGSDEIYALDVKWP